MPRLSTRRCWQTSQCLHVSPTARRVSLSAFRHDTGQNFRNTLWSNHTTSDGVVLRFSTRRCWQTSQSLHISPTARRVSLYAFQRDTCQNCRINLWSNHTTSDGVVLRFSARRCSQTSVCLHVSTTATRVSLSALSNNTCQNSRSSLWSNHTTTD